MTIVPQPGCHSLLAALRCSIVRIFSKLAELIIFPLAENSRIIGKAASQKKQKHTMTWPVHPIPLKG